MGNRARRKQEREARTRKKRIIAGATIGALLVGGAAVWYLTREIPPPEITGARIEPIYQDGPSPQEVTAWRVQFHAHWGGNGEPPQNAIGCTLSLMDEAGDLSARESFGLYVGEAEGSDVYVPQAVERDGVQGPPVDAAIACEKHPEGRYEIEDPRIVEGWRVAFTIDWDTATGDGPLDCTADLFVSETGKVDPLATRSFSLERGQGVAEVTPIEVSADEVENVPVEVDVRCRP